MTTNEISKCSANVHVDGNELPITLSFTKQYNNYLTSKT